DADDPLRATLFQPGENSATAARRIAGATRVLDPAYRQELLAAGAPALESTTDPLLRFALAAAPVYETTNEEWSSLTAEEGVQEERLAQALFAVYGTKLPPDATFTLRITDGVV